MKKGQVCEGIVERVDFPGKGIVRAGEERAVVKMCLPGQKVRFSVNKVRKGKAEGRLLEVIEASPLEIGSPCSHFGLCGGCTYLSLPYEEQLKIKEAQVKRLLDGVLEGRQGEWVYEGIKGSPAAYEYRNKMEFSFGDEYKDGPLALGMHRRGSFYDLVTVEDCRIVDGDYRLILKTTQEYFAERKISFFHRMTHVGYLRHLLVRKASKTGEILVALVTSSRCPEGVDEAELINGFRDHLLALRTEIAADGQGDRKQAENGSCGSVQGEFAGILHIVNDSVADVVQSDRTDILYGKDYFYEELLGLRFKISVFSFFQTNSYSAEVLYRTAREYACDLRGDVSEGHDGDNVGSGKRPILFDLYSGTGTITQLMAPVAEKVIGVEIVEEAVEAARKSAKENGLDNCEFIAGDVLKVLDEVEEKPDLIILDPPRDGIHPKALPKIIAYGVERIVYISCKPTSLVRDLEVFLAGGYQVEKAVAVDQFPWTTGVETVVKLIRKSMDDMADM